MDFVLNYFQEQCCIFIMGNFLMRIINTNVIYGCLPLIIIDSEQPGGYLQSSSILANWTLGKLGMVSYFYIYLAFQMFPLHYALLNYFTCMLWRSISFLASIDFTFWFRWNKIIQKPFEEGDERGLKLVQSILKPIMLRRTKYSKDREGRLVVALTYYLIYANVHFDNNLWVLQLAGQF